MLIRLDQHFSAGSRPAPRVPTRNLPLTIPVFALTMLMLVSLAIPAQAISAATVEFTELALAGQQDASASVSALRLSSIKGLGEAELSGYADRLEIRTTNLTGQSVGGVGLQPQRGGTTFRYEQAQLAAFSSFADMDVLIVPISGASLPRMAMRTLSVELGASSEGRITETGHVYNNRPLLSAGVAGTLDITTSNPSALRIEGTFAVSIWAWNFTVAAQDGDAAVVTGAYRRDVVSDPATGMELAWTEYQQVAQLEITNGWLDIKRLDLATARAHATTIDIAGIGDVTIDGVTGLLGSQQASNGQLQAQGTYGLTASSSEGLTLQLRSLVGSLDLNGVPIRLGHSGPLRDGSITARQTVPYGAWIAGIVGIMALAVLVKGPAQMGRFNRIQSRFESKDYVGVLTRIEPFTRRPRFQRQATFLKAVSLLSLHEYQEAALYLGTLGSHEAPEPATKAFLQACAAAGLGQDSTVIKHLSDCFQSDPSYIEEARTVPVLASYLPYFDVASARDAAT